MKIFNIESKCRQISATKQALVSASINEDLGSIAQAVRHLDNTQLSGFAVILFKIMSVVIRLFFGNPAKINRLLNEDKHTKEILKCSRKFSQLADFQNHIKHPFIITAGKVDTIATRYQLKAYKARIFSQRIDALKTFIAAPSSDDERKGLYSSTPEKLLKLLRNTADMYAPPEIQVKMTAQNFDIWLKKLSALKDAYGLCALDQLSELYQKKCNVLFEINRLRVLQSKLSSKEIQESVEELTKEFIDTTKTHPPHAEITRETLGSIISNTLASLEGNTLPKIDSLLKDLLNSVYDEFALHQISAERLHPLIPEEEIAKPLTVTMIGAEFTGFVKEGGLAEALEGMTKGLKAQNQQNKVRVILPNFSTFPASIKEKIALNPPLNFQTAEGVEYSVSILNQDGIDFYLINHSSFQLKGEKASIYGPDDETVKKRFVTFTNLAADLAKRTPTDVIHLHDWHVAGVALKLKKENPKNWKTGTVPPIVFTYHNNSRGAQGRLSSSGIYNYDSVVQGLIEAGIASEKVNVFAEVLKVADCVTTVSETFAIESQEVETGKGVSFAVREAARMGKLTGIINGSNPHSWNPEEDNTLKHWRGSDGSEIDLSYQPNLSPLKISSKKSLAKRELQKWIQRQFPENQFDPTKPIVTFIGRFDSKQKGLINLKKQSKPHKRRVGNSSSWAVWKIKMLPNCLTVCRKSTKTQFFSSEII